MARSLKESGGYFGKLAVNKNIVVLMEAVRQAFFLTRLTYLFNYWNTMNIEQLLARRTDLSTFLVHLTRSNNGTEPIDGLIGILRDQKIKAESPFGMAVKKLERKSISTDTQKTVCFTETPLENVNLLTEVIDGRECQFRPYGIAITRKQARQIGANPIWYLDITPNHSWLTEPLNKLIDDAIEAGDFSNQPISKITPFLEQMGTYDGGQGIIKRRYKKEFWWEREWRHVGDFHLPARYIVLCPSAEIKRVKYEIEKLDDLQKPQRVSYVDPMWSLEMIIGKLAGFESDELGAF